MTDKVAVVTGATSGIGEQIARKLAREGARVLITGRSVTRGGQIADELGESCCFFPADIAEAGAAEEIIGATISRYGRVDVLVNNAAVDHTGDLLTVTDDEIRATFEINTFAAIRMLQAAAANMRIRGGAIINITSRLASIGVPTMGIYSASKGAMLAMTRAAAVELAPLNIRVNAVAPGMTKTPLYDEWLAGQEDPAAEEADVVSKIPLRRLAVPDDVASAVAYLASDEAAYLTGVSLPVDGGYTAH
ncbi:NAD(P)-dependent dehydrogenase (short-subunit alcohol dehydrogenase family) [Arthrobacter sp. B3I9]|uniref:SDR family NAD(P)-dependent oxidoreductase n=1 Tax=Arthrobacter sp. B3I9 TaxID=3042270 RepID=UPI00279406CE|nr:SDR family oxidoreductase [Arthrobacter sp. B3I9]MDQ0848133.1 NAD(P)-dependent dehydrogenase (short-subunit alcohol dehydrogenase family) [Arthrobacter sp. B3I9]